MWFESLVPQQGRVDFKIFYCTSDNTTTSEWQLYRRPAGAKWLMALVMGGGSGGAGGCSRPAGEDGGGGGSGVNSAISRGLWLWDMLPDTLFVQVASGGPGGAADVAGAAARPSKVAFMPGGSSVSQYLIQSSNGFTTNPSPGTTTAGGAGGGGSSVLASTQGVGLGYGAWFSTAGNGGIVGGAHTGAVGGSISLPGSLPTTRGASGAGSSGQDFAGGNITGSSLIPTVLGGQNPGDPGGDGFCSWKPFFMTGGAGGASNDAGTGGKGGDGAYGCGGGGGGAGVTGGAGGRGGDGLVMFWSW